MSDGFDKLNLLPSWYRDRVVLRRWERAWGLTLGCVVPTVAAAVVLTHVLLVRPADRLTTQVQVAEGELAQRRAQAPARPAPVKIAGPKDPRETEPSEWRDLLRMLASMSGRTIGFQELDVRIGENHSVRLSIKGLAEDSQSVLRFAATVERAGVFAPMNSPAITFDDATGSVRFEMSARIDAVASATEGTE